jgi:fructose-bisphosphate aldolase class 1
MTPMQASDESNATTGKRLDSVGVENTETNRRDWRQTLYTTPGESLNRSHSASHF